MRVLLLEVPQLLREILEHAITKQGDCELLKSAAQDGELETEHRIPPDVVILGLTAAEDSALVPVLFGRWPWAQVMTVRQTGNDATVYELRPRRRALGQMSAEEMVATLRAAVSQAAGSRKSR